MGWIRAEMRATAKMRTLVLLGLLAGCERIPSIYQCGGSQQCEPGFCEANGFCSFVDSQCASGRRYGNHAGPEFADLCVVETMQDGGLPDVRITPVRDASNESGREAAADATAAGTDASREAGIDATVDCDDHNPCTTDSFDLSAGCQHVPAGADIMCRAAMSPCQADAYCTGTSTTCPANPALTVATPVLAFDASPVSGNVCSLPNAIGQDGQVVGLDDATANSDGFIDSVDVTGCVGVDFGHIANFDPVTVRAGTVAMACTYGCTGAQCGTGHSMQVFRGTVAGTYRHFSTVNLTSQSLTDYVSSFGEMVRYVVVCRSAWSLDRDDVVVDSIAGTCN
jgi:hypothetical protein